MDLWLGRPGQETLQRGIQRELAEQSADASHDTVIAPPCTVCGKPVKDADWEKHKRFDHGIQDAILPYGTPSSRELFIPAFTIDELEKKKSAWRAKHPGLLLALAGEGSRANGRILWQRFRVLDQKGRPVR
jgi:hypothetical protein